MFGVEQEIAIIDINYFILAQNNLSFSLKVIRLIHKKRLEKLNSGHQIDF